MHCHFCHYNTSDITVLLLMLLHQINLGHIFHPYTLYTLHTLNLYTLMMTAIIFLNLILKSLLVNKFILLIFHLISFLRSNFTAVIFICPNYFKDHSLFLYAFLWINQFLWLLFVFCYTVFYSILFLVVRLNMSTVILYLRIEFR